MRKNKKRQDEWPRQGTSNLPRLVAARACTGGKLTPCPREEGEDIDDIQSQGRESWPPARAAPPRSSAHLSDSRLLRPSAYQESTGEKADWSQGCRHLAAAGSALAAGPGVLAHPSRVSVDQPWPGEAWGGPGRTPFFRELATCDSIPGNLK